MAKRVVISLFDNEAAADSAAAALKDSGMAKHDAIGVLALDEKCVSASFCLRPRAR